MKKYFLNTDDPQGRYNMSEEEVAPFFDQIERGMIERGYHVERVCVNDARYLYDDEEQATSAGDDATEVINLINEKSPVDHAIKTTESNSGGAS